MRPKPGAQLTVDALLGWGVAKRLNQRRGCFAHSESSQRQSGSIVSVLLGFFGSGMGFIIDLGQMLVVQMGVNLSGG